MLKAPIVLFNSNSLHPHPQKESLAWILYLSFSWFLSFPTQLPPLQQCIVQFCILLMSLVNGIVVYTFFSDLLSLLNIILLFVWVDERGCTSFVFTAVRYSIVWRYHFCRWTFVINSLLVESCRHPVSVPQCYMQESLSRVLIQMEVTGLG